MQGHRERNKAVGIALLGPALVILGFAGCGDDDAAASSATSSCDLGGTSTWACFEWVGEPFDSTKMQCAGYPNGVWSAGPCSRSKAVGGCRIHVGNKSFTAWEGGDLRTEEVIRDHCLGAEYVPGEANSGTDGG